MSGDGSVPSAPFNGADKVIPFNRRHGDFGMRKIFKDKLNSPSFCRTFEESSSSITSRFLDYDSHNPSKTVFTSVYFKFRGGLVP